MRSIILVRQSAVACLALLSVILISCGCSSKSDFPADRTPGVSDNAYYLPNGWRITPAGTHRQVNDLPTNIVISPDGNYAAILSSGWQDHTVYIMDLKTKSVVDSQVINRAWLGLCFNPSGDHLYVSGGNQDKIHEFSFSKGKLQVEKGFSARGLEIGKGGDAYFWTGIAVHPSGKYLYAAECNNSNIFIFNTESHAFVDSISIATRPYMRYTRLPNPTAEYPMGYKREVMSSPAHPYTFKFDPEGKLLYISNWVDRSVSIMSVAQKVVVRNIPVGEHPNDLVLSSDGRLFVANASSNTVSVIDTKELKVIETISTTLYPLAPEGSTPNALALDENLKRLYVANADNNCLCVVDISNRDESEVVGFIPTGWYPSSVALDEKNGALLVGNGKGLATKPNPEFAGPQNIPKENRKPGNSDYIGKVITGAVSVIPVPDSDKLEKYTEEVYDNCPYNDEKLTQANYERKTAVPTRVGDPSPIKYVIYIIKENRTYDQVFGDLPQGKGDPEICLFPREVSPNHHKLAEEYVLFDNFYCDGEVSQDGWSWSTGAYATDFTEKIWQSAYSRRGTITDQTSQLATPPALYIWDQCARFGVSYVSYGVYRFSPGILGHSVDIYPRRQFASEKEERANNYTDRYKVDNWIAQFDKYAAGDSLPRFQILGMGNDHNFGTAPGRPTPKACMSENDFALARLVEHVSKSKYWKETAIFVIEDDAQNGPDHIDCHRTAALLITPYARRGYVDHTLYTTSSMLRTMELILGLPPLSQFDAAATPMFEAFTDQPVFDEYTCLPPGPDIDKINEPNQFGALESEHYSKLGIDQAPDLLWSEITWKAIKGVKSEMPAPVRRAFLTKSVAMRSEGDGD